MSEPVYRAKSGRVLTEHDIEELSAEAERGYDPDCLVPRRRQEDPCPQCGEADLEPRGGKHVCPACHFVQPCCNP